MVINKINTEDLVYFQTVIEIIKEQFQSVMDTDPEFYSNYNFEIKNEQYFVGDDERETNKIFMIVKFLPADIDYGQNILPVTIQAISESNGMFAAQKLLLEYAQIFNLNTLERDGKLIYQNYKTPSVTSNFEVVYDGFRSLLTISGTFLISGNINRIKLLYYDGDSLSEAEKISNIYTTDLVELTNGNVFKWDGSRYVFYKGDEIDILNYSDTFDSTPDTQPYFERKNFTESIIKYGTFSFNITSFLTRSTFNDKILKLCSRKINVNCNFYFKIKFDNGLDMPLLSYKLLNVSKQQNVGELPSIVVAFTN